jgi:amylosucrase
MTADMLNLCNHGIDIIRLDATPYIWKQLGTDCRNLPQVHTLVRLMRMATEVVCPGTLLLGEVVMEPSKVVPYFGTLEKPECHMLYNVTTMASTWHTVATHDVRLLRHQMETVFALPHEYTFLNYLRCHDDIGWGLDYSYLRQFGIEEVAHKKYLNDYLTGKGYNSDARGELYNDDPRLGDARLCGTTASLCGIEAAEYELDDYKLDRSIRLDIMLHAFLFTQSGIPVLYSGDEIGQKNDYTYHENPLKWDDSRYLHRGDLNWDEVERRTDLSTREGRIFSALRVLETIRAEHEVFDNEADTWIVEPYNDHILGIGRYYNGEKLIALFNFSKDDETAWINESEKYYDLITGEPREAKAVAIPAYDFVWLLTDFNNPVPKRVVNLMAEMGKKLSAMEEKSTADKKAAAKKTTSKKTAAKKPVAKKNTEEKKTAETKKSAAKKPAAKKPAAKKPTAAKPEAEAEKAVVKAADKEAVPAEAAVPAAEKTEKKAAVKKPVAKKPAAKKPAAKKPAAKKPAAKKAAPAETAVPAEKKTSILKTDN